MNYFSVARQKLEEVRVTTRIFSLSPILRDPMAALVTLKIEPVWYATSKVVCTVVVALAVLPIIVIGEMGISATTALILLGAMMSGFVLPELYIKERLWKRKIEIRAQFPNFLDLLRLYVASSGYEGFAQALSTISGAYPGELGEELRATAVLGRYVSHSRLLEELERRFPYPSCRDLVSTIALEHTFGGEIAPKIAQLADEAQKSRLDHARMVGQRSSVGLLVPLLFFHFPVALTLFILPFAYSILQALGAN